MRAALLLALAACGRFDFDARGADAGGDTLGSDAMMKICLNPAGHDEDADGVDDACDVCPHVVDDQTDTDGDGVGDACDPHPNIPTEKIARFDTFATPPTGWTFNATLPAMYTISGDTIQVDARGGSWIGELGLVPAKDRLAIGGTLGPHGTQGIQVVALVLVQGGGGGQPRYYCQVIDSGGSTWRATYTLDGSTFIDPGSTPLPGTPSAGFSLREDHDPSTMSCALFNNGTQYDVGFTSLPAITPDRIQLYIGDQQVTIDWFIQIHTQ